MSEQGEHRAELVLTGGFDRELIHRRGESVRYFVARVEAPPMPEEFEKKRVPLNAGIVIDVSGSMSGPNIESAKEAARGIVNCLQDGDLFTLVSFDSGVYLHVPAMALDEETRQMALAAIDEMHAGSMTNLSGGWQQGAESLAEAMESNPNRSNRLILLTDGHANQGITHPAELAGLAAKYREQGIYSSAVGIGDGYSTEQIEAIATHGGGTLHDAEHPHEIIEVVTAELNESLAVFADNIKVKLSGSNSVKYDCLNQFPTTVHDGSAEVILGNLVYGRSREIVLRLTMPPGEVGDTLAFTASASYERQGESRVLEIVLRPIELEFATVQQLDDQPRHEARTLSIVSAWHSHVIREALRLHREGRWEVAADYVREQLKHFERYCRNLEGTEKEVGEIRRLVSRIQRPMHERTRKEVDLAMHKRAWSKADHRIEDRASYADFLFKEDGG